MKRDSLQRAIDERSKKEPVYGREIKLIALKFSSAVVPQRPNNTVTFLPSKLEAAKSILPSRFMLPIAG